jgi:hypothetical protein
MQNPRILDFVLLCRFSSNLRMSNTKEAMLISMVFTVVADCGIVSIIIIIIISDFILHTNCIVIVGSPAYFPSIIIPPLLAPFQ